MIAAQRGRLMCLEFLVSRGANVRAETSGNQASPSANGATALFFASQQGHIECVEVLVDAGSAVDHADAEGWTPLCLACLSGCVPVAEVWLCKYYKYIGCA
jgi:ankyrin repeat protein